MVNPMELYEIDESLRGSPSVNRLLEFLQVYYVTRKMNDTFHVSVDETPKIVVREGSRGIEIWPKDGPVYNVIFGNSHNLEELLKKGVLIPGNKFFTHDSYQNKPSISFQIADDQDRRLRKFGLYNLIMYGRKINIFLEPIKSE